MTAAAGALGITPAELGAQLKAGKSLKDVATAKGVPYETVSAAVLASVKADLDAAVAAGTIKQARADRILDAARRRTSPTAACATPRPRCARRRHAAPGS